METLKEKISKLKSEGKSYSEICAILNCAKSTITYHCNAGQKEKHKLRQRKLRGSNPGLQKMYSFQGRKASKSLENRIDAFQRGNRNINTRNMDFTWNDILNKFGIHPICYLTGEVLDLNKPETYSFDHIVPTCLGGDNSLNNLGITSKKANLVKSGLALEEFIQLCKKILEHQGYKVSK